MIPTAVYLLAINTKIKQLPQDHSPSIFIINREHSVHFHILHPSQLDLGNYNITIIWYKSNIVDEFTVKMLTKTALLCKIMYYQSNEIKLRVSMIEQNLQTLLDKITTEQNKIETQQRQYIKDIAKIRLMATEQTNTLEAMEGSLTQYGDRLEQLSQITNEINRANEILRSIKLEEAKLTEMLAKLQRINAHKEVQKMVAIVNNIFNNNQGPEAQQNKHAAEDIDAEQTE